MKIYPRLTKEEFTFFLQWDREFVKRYNLMMSLTRRVRRGLHELCIRKFYGYGGFKQNRDEALQHYEKACAYDPTIRNLEKTTELMETYQAKRQTN